MDDKVCDDCGVAHESVEEISHRLKRRLNLYGVAHFASLIFLDYTFFKLLGLYGALALVAAYGAYVAYYNVFEILRGLEMLRGAEASMLHQEKDAHPPPGQYM